MTTTFSRILLASEHTESTAAPRPSRWPWRGAAGNPWPPCCRCSATRSSSRGAATGRAGRRAAARRREALQALARAAGVTLSLRVRRGAEPFAEIVQAARELPADLIVLRRRGQRSFLANLLVGEMVGKVLAHAPCQRAARAARRATITAARRASRAGSTRTGFGLARPGREPGCRMRPAAARVVCVALGEETRATAQQALQAALLGARSRWPCRRRVARGPPLPGTAGRGPRPCCRPHRGGPPPRETLGRAWIGGVAQKVVGLAECPVLVHVNPNPTTSA